MIKLRWSHQAGLVGQVRWASTVNWRPWSSETLNYARQTNKPIFVTSGHSSCHLCHAMDSESFENRGIAQLLNANFVAVRIDKEKQAGVDAAMMLSLQAQTEGQGGWPLNAFLAPTSARPFIAGSYWPRRDFALILDSVAKEWHAKQALCEEFADKRAARLERAMHIAPSPLPVDVERALLSARDEYVDMGRSGPRFPMGYSLAILGGDVLDATLSAIARSGTVDQLEGGVHKYAVSADWHLPCFEKTLSGQATLLMACAKYFETHLSGVDAPSAGEVASPPMVFTKEDAEIRTMALGALQCLISLENSSSFDADDPVSGAEGGSYLWTAQQFQRALQQGGMGLIERDMAEMFWGVNDVGNINKELDTRGELFGKNVLSQYNAVDKVAEAFGQPASNVLNVVDESRRLLRDFRSKTMPPHTRDTNVVVAWNGLAISALVRMALAVPETSEMALGHARETAFRILRTFGFERLSRTLAKDGAACCDDYAFLIKGLLDLYAVEKNPEWLRWAAALQTHQIELFIDKSEGGFFYTQEDATLYMRPKFGYDGAEPSYNGISALSLVQLANLTGVTELEDISNRTIECYRGGLVTQPLGFLSTLEAVKAISKT